MHEGPGGHSRQEPSFGHVISFARFGIDVRVIGSDEGSPTAVRIAVPSLQNEVHQGALRFDRVIENKTGLGWNDSQ